MNAYEPEYRERVYCYEHYNRWRCHWPDGYPYSLAGEIDKHGHPIIRGAAKPDFRMRLRMKRRKTRLDRTLVSCFLHENPGKQAVRVAWE